MVHSSASIARDDIKIKPSSISSLGGRQHFRHHQRRNINTTQHTHIAFRFRKSVMPSYLITGASRGLGLGFTAELVSFIIAPRLGRLHSLTDTA